MGGVGRGAGGTWVTRFSLGSLESSRAWIAIWSSASLLSFGTSVTEDAWGAPGSWESQNSFFSLHGNASSPLFPRNSFIALVHLRDDSSLCGSGAVVKWHPIGPWGSVITLVTLFSIKTQSSVARLSGGSGRPRWSWSSLISKWTYWSHRPRAAGRPRGTDQSRISRFTPVFVSVLFRQCIRFTFLAFGS